MDISERQNDKTRLKARRMTYVMSVFFGFIALFIIIKGLGDMQEKIKRYSYWDRVWEISSDTVFTDRAGNRFRLHAGSAWRARSRRPGQYALNGTVDFDVRKRVIIFTPDTVEIQAGKGSVRSGRFPEIRLDSGLLRIGYDTLQGRNLHWKNGAPAD